MKSYYPWLLKNSLPFSNSNIFFIAPLKVSVEVICELFSPNNQPSAQIWWEDAQYATFIRHYGK